MADKTKLRKVKSKSSAAEKGKQTERLHLPAAAFKRFANDLQKDETTNKFVEINKERVAKFIDRPTELSVSRKREKVEVKDKKSSVPGIYEYKKQDTHTLLELQKVPEFQKALGDRSRFGEGDGSFFDQWLNSNVIQSSYLYDKDGLPLLKHNGDQSQTGFKKHIKSFKAGVDRDYKGNFVKPYHQRREERHQREALLKAGVDPDKALAEKKFSLSEEIDKIYRKKEKSCRTSSRTARTADSEFENSYLTKDESFLPEISTAQRENYFGDQARLAFFDYYRQLSRQMNSLKPGKYSDSDLSNLLAIEKSRRSDVLMSPSAKSRRASLLALEDEKVGRSICRKSTRDSEDISDGFKANIETLGATVDEKDLFLNHLIADGSDASSLKVADQRPFSARSKFLLGCVNKGLLPQPSLIIRKDYNSILNISFLGIGDEMAKILADSLETLPLLEGLYIADNKLTDAGLVPIIKSLYKCPRLKCLDLSQNKIDILAANALSDYLSSASCSIHQLILKKADVDDIECCQFVLAIAVRHTIAELDLSSNILGSHEIRRNSIDLNRETAGEAVGKLLRDPRCSIETLKLSWNMIRFKSGTELVGALRENQRITYLDISYNGLGVDGGEALGNALHYNKSLIVLKLGHNNITARACCTILSGVRSCLTLKEVDLTENPIGQEGARALLAMNIHEGHRLSMDFSGCSLRLKDPTCWFDPSKPVNSFSLDLCKPYERSVCIELLRLAAEHDNLKIESFKYCSQEEPTLEKELMLSVYSSKDNPDFKNDVRNSLKSQDQDKIYEIASDIESARNLFRQAADKIFRQYDTDESESLDREELSHLLTQLGLESSKPVINKLIDTYDTDGSGRVEEDEFIFFLLDVKDTYEKTQSWTKDTRYIYLVDDPTQNLRKDLVGTPKPFMPADDGKVIIEIRGERTLPEFIHTISKQDVETMLMSSKTVADSGAIFEYALTVMQLKYQEAKSFYRILLKESGSSFAVLRRLLPRVATPSDVRLLLSSVAYQDFSKIHNLKMALGMLYRVYIGLPNGFYRLNLADTVDRYCLQRLIEINNTNSHQRIGLRKGATSQSGNWTNFRNTLVDGIPFTITKEWLTAEPPTKGKIEFDFVSVQEIPLSFPSISNLRLFRVLAALDMTSDDTRAKVLDKLSISAEEGRFAAKASGYRKWEVANTYALEAARHLQTLYDTVDNSRPMRILKDISTEEVVFLDIAKSPRELLDSDQAGEAKAIEIFSSHLRRLQETKDSIDEHLIASRYLEALETILSGRYITSSQLALMVELIPNGSLLINPFSTYRVELIVTFFSRINDVINFDYVIKELKPVEYAMVIFRLGFLNIWNPLKAEGFYYLNLSRWEEQQILRMLMILKYVEPGETWLEQSYKDTLDSPDSDEEWQLPFAWYSENNLPSKGIVGLQFFSGKGMQLRGCAPNLSCRMALMGLVLSLPYEEEMKYIHECTVDKAEAAIAGIGCQLSFDRQKQMDPTAFPESVDFLLPSLDEEN